MKITLNTEKIASIQADCEVVIMIDKNQDHKWIQDKEALSLVNFKGDSEEVALLLEARKVYVGADSFDVEEIRLAVAKALKTLENTSFKTIKIATYHDGDSTPYIQAIAEASTLGTYVFDRYKSKKEARVQKELILSLESYHDSEIHHDDAQKAVDSATIIANATNLAKDIVNAVPDDMTPDKLAQEAQKVADALEGVECFIGDGAFLEKEKMGAFAAVARASIHPPRFIHLSYKPKNPQAKFVFVGKGLTYDSGGLSLKPSDYMVSMKADKSGSAATLAIFKGAVELGLPFEIHTIIGSCENMIGGNAYKPDDILVAKNGVTIEVRNTDAEGRLVLADCLCYACDLKPDYLVDMATLTGACVVAVGEYTTGVMGHNSALKEEMAHAAEKSGELSGTLPFNRYLDKLIKSNIADISNISSSRYGGAITAGLFLDRFISDEMKDKWLHLDIAGPAYIEKDWGYNQCGASGAGVRMCLYWMQEHANKGAL